MATDKTNPEKKVDLPPRGDANLDPITHAPGAHPIETGVGAALGGAAAGLGIGIAAGPVGVAVGAVVGAIAGGLGGHAVGEWIDPTTTETHLHDTFPSKPYVQEGETFEHYQPAYQYGGQAEARYQGKAWHEVENDLQAGWDQARGTCPLSWDQARPAVREGFDRTAELRQLSQMPGHSSKADLRQGSPEHLSEMPRNEELELDQEGQAKICENHPQNPL
ncbi:MAG TPA: hypothetical protein VFA18_13855 [Gemmataceae bacterium]|nr:hypothetical protein [Gemmataceae bacterium]